MNDVIEATYCVANNSVYAPGPKKATKGSAGFDLFAAKEKMLQPRCVTPVAIEYRWRFQMIILENFIRDRVF